MSIGKELVFSIFEKDEFLKNYLYPISKLFKNIVGVTIQDYLISFRINKAKEMMKDKQLSIGDISRSVGYDNPLIFSGIFKKVNGISPSKYRDSI